MNFKRLVSGVCAFSIAVTQTAIVPISVSAVDYISVPNFTDQFKVGGCVNSTTGKNEWEHGAWDGPADPIAPSEKQFIIDKTTMATTETPDESRDVQFTFSTVIDEGYYQGGDEFDFTVYDLTVTLTKNAGEGSEPVTEILSNAKDHSWTLKRNEGGWFEGNLTFVPEEITIDNFKDFADNCSIKYEWSNIECTASRRAYFESVNAELWSGSSDLGDWNWDNRVVLPRFDKAEKFSRLAIEYTVNDPNSETDPVICVADGTNGTNISNIYPGQFEDGYGIPLPKDAGSITLVLTEDAAKSLKNGAMYIHGTNVTLTAVRSLEADMSSIVSLNETNFPNATFRGFIEEKCDVNGDKLLTPAELGKVEDINFSKPDETDTGADQTYADEKYRQIDDFTGIEYLTNLRWFSIDQNTAVESIDLSKNTKIGFASLDRCTKLSEANFAETLGGVNLCETLITEFDGSKYPNLGSLYLNSNVLTNVDVSTNTKLEALGIFGTTNGTGTVSDLSRNTALKDITLCNCTVGKLDLSKCKNLTKLSIDNVDAAGIDLTGLSFEEYEVSNIYHNITLTDGKFDLDSLSDLGFDPAKAAIADGQGVTRNKNILTVEDGVSEINYTYDTGLKGKSIDATFRVGGRTFGSVNATLWKGDKKFPHNWSENILLPAFDKAAAGTRLTVEYTVTAPTAEELGNDEDWLAMIGFIDNTIDDEHPNGRWKSLMDIHPDQDGENGNIVLDKDSSSITVTLTAEAAKALNDGVMFINGCNITVTAVKSLEADPNPPEDIELNSTNFPNKTFLEIAKSCDTDSDGKLTYFERAKLRYLDLSKPDENDTEADKTYADDKYRQIDNFKGIEYFTNLQYVNIGGNTAVTSIDLSNSTKLHDFNGANCSKLEKVVLPEGVKEVYIFESGLKEFDAAKYPKLEVLKIFNTQVTSIDVSKNPNLRELDLGNDKLTSDVDISNCPELTELSVRITGIKKLDVSKNKKLEKLDIGYNGGIELIGIEDLTTLKVLTAWGCGLKKLDVSKNKGLEKLDISGNSGIELIGIEDLTTLKELVAWGCGLKKLDISKNKGLEKLDIIDNSLVAIDLTGLDSLTEVKTSYQGRDIELINNTFNLADLSAYGLDPGKVTLAENCGAERNGNVLTFPENVGSIPYTYDTGKDGVTFTVTLNVAKRIESNFTVSYVENDKTVTVTADEWADVLKVMNNKNIDYVVNLNNDVEVKKLTFPTAAKAKSIAVYNPSGKTITTDASSITLPIDTTFDNISIESTAKTFTITASKNLDISDFRSEKLKTLKGGAKSVLTFNQGAHNTVKADISGFGTIAFDKFTEAELLGTVKATTLKLNDSATVIVKNNSVTFTNIEIAGEEAIMASICYGTDNFKPITVTGNITAENNASKIRIYKRVEKNIVSFSAEQTVLTAKTASFANVEVFENSMPEGEINYTLARVGSDIKLLAEKLKVVTLYDEGGMNETVYAQWSDVLSTIAANAKAGQKDNEYHVTLLDNYNMNGVFKMPAAKTYSSLNFSSEQSVKTITFTGNITLTGFTIFNNIKLDAQKKVGKEFKPTDFTIAAGKNSLQLEYVNANIKSITSSGEVELTGTTVGAVTANSVKVWANSESGMLGYAAMGAAWDGKTAPTTTVNITGNLTVKKLLELENNSSLSVGGIINAGEIFALDDTVLVVKQQAKGKNALVIGKSGFDNGSGKIKFVLVDPETEKTAEITENLILGTIAGPYADQLVPSNDNLTEADSYYIIKDGKNLIAKPKATEGLVTVDVNGKKAYYKSLDDAIKDINATGSKNDTVTITLTQDMFSKPIAKLPLPSAGKYALLRLTADSDITINITGDIALTGKLFVEDKISINKVKVTGKGDNMTTEVVPVSINVGKYYFLLFGKCSADPETGANRIANISGPGEFVTNTDTVITGKVNGASILGSNINIKLDGKNAAFTGSIVSSQLTFTYDKSISKNVKFKDIVGSIKLVIKDGDNEINVSENDIIAAITGDYIGGSVTVNDSELKIVRSGNNLKAVKKENVVSVGAYYSNGKLAATRIYDSVASSMNDISRIKNKDMNYKVPVKENDVLVLPKAKTYDSIYLESDTAAVITTAKDLTLTGNLSVGENITVNKADGKAMSINLNNYGLLIEENAHIAYDAENKVSRFVNISGKGIFMASENITVSGKVNVGTFSALKTTLGEKSSFSAALIEAYEGDELNYPVKIAKNVKFGGFHGEILTANVSGLEKPNTQIASFTGSYIENFIQIGDGDTYTVVPSGNKLMAVAKADAKTVKMTVSINDEETTYLFDTYENAVKAIAKLGSADAKFIINVTDVQPANGKLTLPTKGKYKTLELSSSEDVVIKLKSDVTLTGNLIVSGKITLQKNNGGAKDILKFTTNAKDNFTVTVQDDANIINGKLVIGKNMTDIRNPDDQ